MKIIIKNISKKVTVNSLSAIFSTYGKVASSSLLYYAGSHENSKTAIITMPNEKEARDAIEHLNGCVVDGQALLVAAARTKTKTSFFSYYTRVRSLLTPKEKKYQFLSKE